MQRIISKSLLNHTSVSVSNALKCIRTINVATNHFSTTQTKQQVFSPVLKRFPTYEQVYDNYKPNIPKYYNIGFDICDKHVKLGNGSNTALIFSGDLKDDNEEKRYTYSHLSDLSHRFANALKSQAQINKGDRVAIFLPQCAETVITHISVYKLGGVALPLFTLFGPEAVEYRLNNSEAKSIVTDEHGLETVLSIGKHQLPHLSSIYVVRSPSNTKPLPVGVFDFYQSLNQGSGIFDPVVTSPEDSAIIIYTSGTTGTPKGCVHAHRVLLGHLPGVELPQDFFPQQNDLFWTPADWAWIGGLLDVLLPSMHHGVPVLAHRSRKFDPDECFDLMNKYRVKNTFMPPTALRLIRKNSTRKYQLRSLGSGGETLGQDLLEWGKETFGVTINEFYGQTECNLILSNSASLFPVRVGSMGKPVPGKTVGIVNDAGELLPVGAPGNIAVKKPDNTMFLSYFNNPKATKDKFKGEWLITGDQGRRDEEGYYWFVGRDDDIITSGAYRIGPSEIEDCVLKHDKVALCAAIGKPDAIRTEIVKTFVVLKKEYEYILQNPKEAECLSKEIQNFVKIKLAAHEYPREVEFVNELPMTTTGKIIRKALKQREIDKTKTTK